jgi:ankyrin repeat protein/thiol-disulfide isomerase/thioredoxin
MYPEYYQLARVLNNHEHIRVCKMQGDGNKLDRHLIPENFYPNVKLFPKNKKRTPVCLYDNMSRTFDSFVRWIQEETGISLAALLSARFPDYCVKNDVEKNLNKMIDALFATVPLPLSPRQFMSSYFMDPDAFSFNGSRSCRMTTSNNAGGGTAGGKGDSTVAAATKVGASSESQNQPFSFLGDTFLSKSGLLKSKSGKSFKVGKGAIEGKTIGIYFSAHWCPPCRAFTPKLAETYKKLKEQGKDFEIVFASADHDESSFDEYYAEMPWLALPFKSRGEGWLSQKYRLAGIPSLVLLNPDGTVITTDGYSELSADKEGKKFPWIQPAGLLSLKFDKKIENEIELFEVDVVLDAGDQKIPAQSWNAETVQTEIENLIQALQLNQPEDLRAFTAQHFHNSPLVNVNKLKSYGGVHTPALIQNVSKKSMQDTDVKKVWSQLSHALTHTAGTNAQHAIEIVSKHVKQGYPINARPFGDSLLHVVSAMGHCTLAAFLLINGADLQLAREKDQSTACEVAAAMGHLEVFQLFVRNGACVGRSMHIAASTGHIAMLQFLLEEGRTNVNCRSSGYSVLETAILFEHMPAVKLLLGSHGLDVSRECSEQLCGHHNLGTGSNVMHMAAKLGRLKTIEGMKMLLEETEWFSLLTKENDKGLNPFQVADYVVRGQLQEGYLAVWDAVQHTFQTGETQSLTDMLERKNKGDGGRAGDPNAQDAAGWTPLMLAAVQDNAEMAATLLSNDADVFMQSKNGFSALLWAEWMNSDKVKVLLKSKGAVLSNHDTEGLQNLKNALLAAERTGDDATVALLRCTPTAVIGVGSQIIFSTVEVTITGGEHHADDTEKKGHLEQGALEHLSPESLYQVQLLDTKRVVSILGRHLRLKDANNPAQLIEQRMQQQQGQTQMVSSS